MEKLMKNWIFTMVVCILVTLLAVVMLLGALEVKNFTFARDILHLLAAVVLLMYVIFALFPLVARYRGTLQVFEIGEVALLLLTVVGQTCQQWFDVPVLSRLAVCSVFGLAFWARGVVEIVHAYLTHGTESKKKIPLWGLCLYILLCAFGIWQVAKPSIQDKYFLWCIFAVSVVVAGIFAYATIQNRKKTPHKPKTKKKKAETKTLENEKALTDGKN